VLQGPNFMSTVEKEGYLSKQITQWIEKHRSENSAWFELCEDINRFSHTTMFTMTIHSKHLPEIIVASLYIRAMSNFQGIILMAERGMINEARALLRCLIECEFAIVAIDKDKAVVQQFVLEDQLQRRDYLRAYKRNKKSGIPHPEDAPSLKEIDDLLQGIESQIKKNHIRRLSKRDLAQKANLVTIYDSAYKVLSGTIHVNVRNLEEYLELNEAGEIKKLLWGPDVKEIDFILFTAAETMLFVLTAVSHIFSLSYDDIWKDLLNKYKSLGKDFSEQA
jgi:hypothetical protein